ncbi:MAG TPA: ectonucleotide pyrophosphatase/phosphodiesterase, partial [Tepidisphaeraceae bacterium]|nr:ectonucleotide pyrophosphatase/phosphodiesterase [Tepidisphaeraceae bacterium]
MTRLILLVALGVTLVASVSLAQTTKPATTRANTPPTTRPVPAISRVLIISVDGCRPDLIFRAHTPNIHKLIEEGSFTFWAKSTPMANTLPSHVSMLTGVGPARHAIMWNGDLPLSVPVYPLVPTIFEVAHNAGYTTGVATGKSKFDIIAKPGTIDHGYFPDQPKTTDPEVAMNAVQIIRQYKPQVMFVHFPGNDSAGHKFGWGTPEQIEAIEQADVSVGAVMRALEELKLKDSTLIIFSADHGGAGRTHGPDDVRSRTIPWIAVGPGIRKNFDLTRFPDLNVATEDTCATAMWALGLNPPKKLDGKPILEMLDARELMTDAPMAYNPQIGAASTTQPNKKKGKAKK